jgi:hypothetical protein
MAALASIASGVPHGSVENGFCDVAGGLLGVK